MSWLFLTEQYAYKLKKPVRRNEIDHRTLAMRRLSCKRELRLNRRLARDVYLGIVALRASSGRLSLGGPGRTVDWLVRMRRLPDALTLECAMLTGHVTRPDACLLRECAPTASSKATATCVPSTFI
jgi:aminoglycoside phosphotransferase family enzyme